MKAFLVIILAFPLFASATNQYFLIDSASMKQKTEDAKYEHITGRVLPAEEKGGQLKFYIRNCGKLVVPRNVKGDIPKAGQIITATLKSHCAISDWK